MVANGAWVGKTRLAQRRLERIRYVQAKSRSTQFTDPIYLPARSKTLTKLAIDWQDTLKKAASED